MQATSEEVDKKNDNSVKQVHRFTVIASIDDICSYPVCIFNEDELNITFENVS